MSELPLGPRPRPHAPRGCAHVSEAPYQAQIIQLAEQLGYRVMHVRRSVAGLGKKNQRWQTATSVKGWPDLTLWRPGRFLLVEVKGHDGRLEPEQEHVLDGMLAAGIDVLVTWPWELQDLAGMLARRAAA